MNDIPIWVQVLAFLIGVPIAMLLIYMVTRVIATACINSWWDAKVTHTKKLLDVFKEKPQNGEEGKHVKR